MNYDNFHSRIDVQKKIISFKNFTYRNTLKLINIVPKTNRRTVLDYGCGVGTVDFYLAKNGSNVLGLEVSQKAIAVCKKSAQAIGVSERCVFASTNTHIIKKFDLILCSEVIEHVKDDKKLLTKLCDLLNKGGYMFVSTPSVNAPLYKLGLLSNFDKRVGHLRRYELNELVAKLKSHKLKIIRIDKKEGILRNSLFVFSELSWMIRFLKGPLSDLVSFIDEILVRLIGESNLLNLVKKQ